ncbi:MAG: Gfo/Idh/MocA family protein, partial [Planctomycetaceae bacterium]
AKAEFGGKVDTYEDYRDILARRDIDVVTIGSPDHWHTTMVINACRAGKDVYCEKPLTLTIDEGKQLVKVVRETGRVLQVGSWQRSDENFRLGCEIARSGRLGKIKRVEVVLGKNEIGGPFQPQQPPKNLNWNLWQGQTPDVPYIPERCHYTFRWWLEYSGGQMTDWGAHNVDIAQWAIGHDRSGPVEIESKAKFPTVINGYNVPLDFEATLRYADGIVVTVKDTGRSGVLVEGEAGRIFMNRGVLSGKPVEELTGKPFARAEYKLYPHDNLDRPIRTGKLDAIINHMGNFFDCLRSRHAPLSDVESQHRSTTACHLANISMRLGRSLKWDPKKEHFVGDDEANRMLSREQRTGFEIPA